MLRKPAGSLGGCGVGSFDSPVPALGVVVRGCVAIHLYAQAAGERRKQGVSGASVSGGLLGDCGFEDFLN